MVDPETPEPASPSSEATRVPRREGHAEIGARAGQLLPVELTTEIITTVDGIRSLKPDYERLARVSGNTLPFALHDWHLTWCDHFLNTRRRVEAQPLFFVLRNRSGDCVTIAPLIQRRWRAWSLSLTTVDVIGTDPALTEIRGPLVEPGYERPSVRALHEGLAALPDWDWVHWHGIGGALLAAMDEEIAPQWYRVNDDYVLDLPSTWEQFRSGLRRNIRESLRHCYNSLQRDGHNYEFVVARLPREIRPALERFVKLHAMRAVTGRGPKHPDHFAGRRQREFLYDVCGRLAERDAVRVFQLRIRGEVVAARVAFVVGDGLYLYYSGFDPAWAHYSVMTTTVAESLRYAITQGLKTANLSLTAEQSKLRWGPRRVELRSGLVHRELLRSRLACALYRIAMSRSGVRGRLLHRLLRAGRPWG